MKTLAVRMLDRMKIDYELREYEWSEDELDAVTVAQKIGMAPEMVFKTLVARGDRSGIIVACIPAAAELDLKRFSAASGNKRVELVPVKEIQSLTGYIRGGVSPLGMKRNYPLFIDKSALQLSVISVSAGRRGLQMILAPRDLEKITDAQMAELVRVPASNDRSDEEGGA